MILIDSSVWVHYYRPDGNDKIKDYVKKAIIQDLAAICGVVRVEILGGVTRKKEYELIDSDFSGFHNLTIDEETFMRAAELGSRHRKTGYSLPATDLIIAATALRHNATLYHIDAHFEHITSSGLKTHYFKKYLS